MSFWLHHLLNPWCGKSFQSICGLLLSKDTVWREVKKKKKNGGHHQQVLSTTVTLQRTGHPSKINERTKTKLIRRAAKRPTATLKELQGCLERSHSACDISHRISLTFFMSVLWGRVTQKKSFLKKKSYHSKPWIKMCYVLMWPWLSFLDIIQNDMFW